MNLELNGKKVLITGGSKGIGLACADAFRAEGAMVAICSRSAEHLEKAAATRPGLHAIAADLSDAAEAARAVADAEKALGAIDILVNSAGAARRTAPDDLTPAFWRAAMDAKYFTYIHVIDPVVKHMAAHGKGVIVNVIGVGGKVAMPSHIAGGAANAALMLATAGLGAVYAPKGVRVVGVSPGLTETDRVAEGLVADAKLLNMSIEQARAENIARLPLGRMASAEEIADTVLFVASDRGGYITGTTISVDGGLNPVVL
ncbi:MAG TPA: SDR family oxidoreductase [Xanthobacteraceae bacterium]|nr:SDR family oxidoreductase [Xanthobacteraceae bacterium]